MRFSFVWIIPEKDCLPDLPTCFFSFLVPSIIEPKDRLLFNDFGVYPYNNIFCSWFKAKNLLEAFYVQEYYHIWWYHQHCWQLFVYSFHVEMMNNQLQTKLKDLTANNPNFLFLIFSMRPNVKANFFIISLQVGWSFFLQSSQISSSYNKWWIY